MTNERKNSSESTANMSSAGGRQKSFEGGQGLFEPDKKCTSVTSLPLGLRHSPESRFSKQIHGNNAEQQSNLGDGSQVLEDNYVQRKHRPRRWSRSSAPLDGRFSPPHRRRSPRDRLSDRDPHFGRSPINFDGPDTRNTFDDKTYLGHHRSRSPTLKRRSSSRNFSRPPRDRCFSPRGPPSTDWSNDTRRVSPNFRRPSPGNRYFPSNVRRSPDARHFSPQARRFSPDGRRFSPDRRFFPDRSFSPDRRFSPDRHFSPDRAHFSPDRRRFSPNVRRFSPDARRFSPDARRFSPDARRFSPDARRFSPDARRFSPDARRFSPDARRFSPDARRLSPDTRRLCPDARRLCPDARPFSPDARRFSPHVRHFSPDSRRFSADARRHSPSWHPGPNERRQSFAEERPHRSEGELRPSPHRKQDFRNDTEMQDRRTHRSIGRSRSRGTPERFRHSSTDRRRVHRSSSRADSLKGPSSSLERNADDVQTRNGSSTQWSSACRATSPRASPLQSPNGAESRPSQTSTPASSVSVDDFLIKSALSSLAVLHNDECRAYIKRPMSHPRYNTELSVYLGSPQCLSMIASGTPQNSVIEYFNSHVWTSKLQEVFEEDWQKKKQDMLKLMSENKRSPRRRKKNSDSTSKRAHTRRSSSHDDEALGKKSPTPLSFQMQKDNHVENSKSSSSTGNLQSNDTNVEGVQVLDMKSSGSSKDLELNRDMKTNKSSATGDPLSTIYAQLFKAAKPPSSLGSEASNPNISEKQLTVSNRASERYSPGMESDTSAHSPNLLGKLIEPPLKKKRSHSPELNTGNSSLESLSSHAKSSEGGEDETKPDVNVVSALSVVNELAHKIGDLAEGIAELLHRAEVSVKHGIDPLKCFFENDQRLCASVHRKLDTIVSATSTSFIEKVIVREALNQLSSLLALFQTQPRKVSEKEIRQWANLTRRMNSTDTILFIKKRVSEEQGGFVESVEQLYMTVKERHKKLNKSNVQDKISFSLPSTGDSHFANKSSLLNSRNLNKSENPSLMNRVHPAFSVYDDLDDDGEDG